MASSESECIGVFGTITCSPLQRVTGAALSVYMSIWERY